MTNTVNHTTLPGHLTIAAVERDTGIGKDTLRVWERRYGFPRPARDAAGERLYPPEQVDKLRLVRRLLDQGLRPGRLLAAGDAELAALAGRATRSATPIDAEHEALLGLVGVVHREALRGALAQRLMRKGLQRFVLDIVAPMNVAVGEAWAAGRIGVYDEHLYTEEVQNALRGAIHARSVGGGRPRVLLTTFPEEEHGLGILMAEAVLVAEGAHTLSLGTRMPLADIGAAALAAEADVVALSFSAAHPLRQAAAGIAELRSALAAGVELWIGGSGVGARPRLPAGVHAVGPVEEVIACLGRWRAAHGAAPA